MKYFLMFLSFCATISIANQNSLYIKNTGGKAMKIAPDSKEECTTHIFLCSYVYGGDNPCNTILNNQYSKSLLILPNQNIQIVDGDKLDDQNWWQPSLTRYGHFCTYTVYNSSSGKTLHLKTSEAEKLTCVREKGEGSINATYDSDHNLNISDGNGTDTGDRVLCY